MERDTYTLVTCDRYNCVLIVKSRHMSFQEEKTEQQQQSQEDSASDDIDFPLPSMISPG